MRTGTKQKLAIAGVLASLSASVALPAAAKRKQPRKRGCFIANELSASGRVTAKVLAEHGMVKRFVVEHAAELAVLGQQHGLS